MNGAGRAKPGEQARSTLLAMLVVPVSRRAVPRGERQCAATSCWQLALEIAAQTGGPAKGLDKRYPSPEGTDKVVTV